MNSNDWERWTKEARLQIKEQNKELEKRANEILKSSKKKEENTDDSKPDPFLVRFLNEKAEKECEDKFSAVLFVANLYLCLCFRFKSIQDIIQSYVNCHPEIKFPEIDYEWCFKNIYINEIISKKEGMVELLINNLEFYRTGFGAFLKKYLDNEDREFRETISGKSIRCPVRVKIYSPHEPCSGNNVGIVWLYSRKDCEEGSPTTIPVIMDRETRLGSIPLRTYSEDCPEHCNIDLYSSIKHNSEAACTRLARRGYFVDLANVQQTNNPRWYTEC